MNRERPLFRHAVNALSPTLLILLLLTGGVLNCRAGEGGKSLAVGRIDSMPVRAEMALRPLAAHLATQLGDLGFEGGKTVVAEGIPSMTGHLEEGTVDIIIASPYPTMRFLQGRSARPLLMASRHGLSEYRSYLFVRKESGIGSLEDLKGKTISFISPDSTAGYLLPLLSLREAGLEPARLEAADAPVPPGKTGYVFAGEEVNISPWVFYGKTDAGVFPSTLWERQMVNPEAYRREFVVIDKSASVPWIFASAREGLDAGETERIREELLRMHETDAGERVLRAYGVDRFMSIPEGTVETLEALLKRFEERGE
jgi:phosphonate transport system substrate-binding protein